MKPFSLFSSVSQAIPITLLPAVVYATDDNANPAEKYPLNWATLTMVIVFVAILLWIARTATDKTRSSANYHQTDHGITCFQNGLALVGNTISAVSFFGISAAIIAHRLDGWILPIGFIAGWPIIALFIVERLQNFGRLTLADTIAQRFNPIPIRLFTVFGTLSVIVLYLIAQLVAAGQLVQILSGLDYRYAVVIIGILMIVYALFTGMINITWLQIIKAYLLLGSITLLAVLVMIKLGFSIEKPEFSAINIKMDISNELAKDPISVVSLGMALMFGTAGLPHVLMRFFSAPNAKSVRKSVLWATTWIGYLYILILIIGLATMMLVGTRPGLLNVDSELSGKNSMTILYLSKILGGEFLFAIVAAVALVTILAIVTSLVFSGASAITQDIYAYVLGHRKASTKKELRIFRITVCVLGFVAIAFSAISEKQDITLIVLMAFAIAASANFPVLVMSLYFKKCTSKGAYLGGFIGLFATVSLMILSNAFWVDVLGNPAGSSPFPWASPTIISMPIAFIAIWLISLTDRSEQALREQNAFKDQYIKSITGFKIAATDDK